MRTRSQARRHRQQQVQQTSVEPPNLKKPNNNPPKDTIADNRTMAELLQAPTRITRTNCHSLNSAAGGNFLDKRPADCSSIIESKSKVRHSRSKAIVAKVSTSASTSGVSPDVAELKDMVRALLLDKQTSPVPAPAPVKAVEQSCVYLARYAECDPEEDILLLEAILNSEPLSPLPNHANYFPKVRKELKICEAKPDGTSIDETFSRVENEKNELIPTRLVTGWRSIRIIRLKYLFEKKDVRRYCTDGFSSFKSLDFDVVEHKGAENLERLIILSRLEKSSRE
ncbi:hypothetical protein Tco_0803158 [Tanacetum coccineum]|uniref:Uncharacterized protein n=1 Tax=Tanacetum coccineum TaxID=301880 RepID=A0ABQ5A4X4_9ASTR